MYVPTKGDWKLFMKKVPDWQERYMGELVQEYIELLQSDKDASEKFWTLSERMKKDKRKNGVQMTLIKSDMVDDILILMREGAVKMKDLEEFSPELRNEVAEVVKYWRKK